MKKRTKRILIGVGVAAGAGGLIYWATRPVRPVLNLPVGLSWGATVSPEFRAKVVQVGRALNINPSFLMAIMRAESGINPRVHIIPIGRNEKGAVIYKRSYEIPIEIGTIGGGLIGFMRKTAEGMGTTLGELLALDGVDQLDYVQKFYAAHQKSGVIGQDPSLWALYMSTFLPKYAKHADEPDFVLSRKGEKVYDYNAAADRNGDGEITIEEAMAKINEILLKGYKKGRVF